MSRKRPLRGVCLTSRSSFREQAFFEGGVQGGPTLTSLNRDRRFQVVRKRNQSRQVNLALGIAEEHWLPSIWKEISYFELSRPDPLGRDTPEASGPYQHIYEPQNEVVCPTVPTLIPLEYRRSKRQIQRIAIYSMGDKKKVGEAATLLQSKWGWVRSTR